MLHLKFTCFQPSDDTFQCLLLLSRAAAGTPATSASLKQELFAARASSASMVLCILSHLLACFSELWCISARLQLYMEYRTFHAAVTREMEALKKQYILAVRNSVPPDIAWERRPLGGVLWQHAAEVQRYLAGETAALAPL